MTHPDRYPDPLTPKPERQHSGVAVCAAGLLGIIALLVILVIVVVG